MGAVISARSGRLTSMPPSARAPIRISWTPGVMVASFKEIDRDEPGSNCPTSNSTSLPAGCDTESGRIPSTITPVAVPVPGFESEISTAIISPINVG